MLTAPTRGSALVLLGLAAIVLAGSALALGPNGEPRPGTRLWWERYSLADPPPEWPPASPSEFLSHDLGAGQLAGVVIAIAGSVVREDPVPSSAPLPAGNVPKATPSPAPFTPRTIDVELYVTDVLAGTMRLGETVVLRKLDSRNLVAGVARDEDDTFPVPRPGQRVLIALREPRFARPDAGAVFAADLHGIVDVSGPTAHFNDRWRTSVTEMALPNATPALIEAIRAELTLR